MARIGPECILSATAKEVLMNDYEKRHVLGLPEMDTQHDYLYKLFDAIESTGSKSDNNSLRKLIHEIEMYLMFHCECEEHLMRMYDFPGFSQHQSDHEQALRRFMRFLDDFDAGMLNCAAMRIFLTGWLMEHSLISDSEYVSWVRKQRSGLES